MFPYSIFSFILNEQEKEKHLLELQSEGQRQVDRLQNINKQLVEGQMD
jgi:hypothetical protein